MNRKAYTIFEIAFIPYGIAVLAMIVGWVANIVQICHIINDPITGMFILKCVGVIVAPLGGILGLIGMW